jgi:uncharacterized protein (TIGR02266 family)
VTPAESDPKPRADRLVFPIHVSFEAAGEVLKEFTHNLSSSGLYLPSTTMLKAGTRGVITLRPTQWDDPLTLEGEVVRVVVEAGVAVDQPAGLGIRFLDVTPEQQRRIDGIVDGIRSGSISSAIRRSIENGDRSLREELRKRSTDQKVIFALSASGTEIEAVIRDGNAAAVSRLLRNPRLTVAHVRSILKDVRLPSPVLRGIKRNPGWMADQHIRQLFCVHPNAPLQDVLAILPALPTPVLQGIARNVNLRAQVRTQARQRAERR